MWYQQYRSKALCVLAVAALFTGAARANLLTVGPTPPNTYATIEAAFADARSGDVIILDDAGSPYTLTAELVVTEDVSPLRIQGQFNSGETPDQIVIQGVAGSPVITVETDAQLTLRHLSVSGGTTGIQALDGSRVTLERVYVDATGAEGMSVTDAEQVEIVGSIFTACGAEGIIVNSGEVDISQSTFIDNTGVAIDHQGGTCQAGACLFYNNNGSAAAQQVNDAGGLDLDYCYVEGTAPASAVSNAIVVNATVTTAFADPENLVFLDTSTWRGQLRLPIKIENPGIGTDDIATDAPFGRDFIYRSRVQTDPDVQVGAHEFAAAADTQVWVDCVLSQNGVPLQFISGGTDEYASAGFVTIEIFLSSGTLLDAALFLEPENGNVTSPTGRVVIPLNDPVPGSENYATADYFIDPDHFVDANGTNLLLDGAATLYLQIPQLGGTAGLDFPGVNTDDYGGGGGGSIEAAAEAGRHFIIDTVPPQVVGFSLLRAHQYVTASTDTYSPGFAVPVWSASGDAPLASSTGVLDGRVGGPEPHLFFNEQSVPGDLGFTLRLEFQDSAAISDGTTVYTVSENAGFAAAPPADPPAMGAAIYTLLTDPVSRGVNPLGFAWAEMTDTLPVDVNTTLNVNYAGGAGANLVVTWAFDQVPTEWALGNAFWESILQFGARDLAGNTSGANPTNSPLIQTFQPFHIWQMGFVGGVITAGPGGRETTTPVINWSVARFGVTPVNTDNAFPIAQYAVYGRAQGEDPNSLGWFPIDANGTALPLGSAPVWSEWISTRRIDQYTVFSTAPARRLGDLVQNPAQYMIVLRAADEAGNVTAYPAGPIFPGGPVYTYPTGAETLGAFTGSPYVADTWTNAGVSIGLDTRVAPTFWHNATGGGNVRDLDPGERTFGAATRIPLPAPYSCLRVEGGFTISMELTDNINPGTAGAYFELFEDGAQVATGFLLGSSGSSSLNLVIPQDLLAGAPNLSRVFEPFLNAAVQNEASLALDCDGDGNQDFDRLGDEGSDGSESPFRKRDVKYRLVVATALHAGGLLPDFNAMDQTPATVEFTVTVDRGLKDDQPIKSFTQE